MDFEVKRERGFWRIPASGQEWEIKRLGLFRPGQEVQEFLGQLL